MAEPDGFLSRWSQRKVALAKGQPLSEPSLPAVAPVATPIQPAPKQAVQASLPPTSTSSVAVATSEPAQAVDAPPLTLADAQALTAESDFSVFAARGVAPEVRNAAMKKLFSNPRYNIQDGLDIYIADYSQPDPLPLSMLRQMASAKALNLFDDDDQPPTPQAALTEPADAGLRLQPHDAAGPGQDPGDPGPDAEPEAHAPQRPVPP